MQAMPIYHCSDADGHSRAEMAAGLLLGALLVVGPGALALEVLTVQELVSHCEFVDQEPEGVDGQYCIRYIQGFIDGAVTTDVRVMPGAGAQPTSPETFSERAKRTRSATRLDRSRATQLSGFCLGDQLLLRDVVDRVVTDLAALNVDETAQSPARDAVYTALREHYPCKNE